MSKPSSVPLWATNTNYPATSDPIKVEPSTGVKQAGWAPEQKPPAQWWNWWMQLVWQWCVWLDAFESTTHTWSATQTFDDVVVNGEFDTNGPAFIQDDITLTGTLFERVGASLFTGATTFGGGMVTFNDDVTFNDPVIWNDTAEFNAAVDFDATVNFAGIVNFDGNVNFGAIVVTVDAGAGVQFNNVPEFTDNLEMSGSNAFIEFSGANPAKTTGLNQAVTALQALKASCCITLNGTIAPTYSDGCNVGSVSQAASTVTIVFAQAMANATYTVHILGIANGQYLWAPDNIVKTTAQVSFLITKISDGSNPGIVASSGYKYDVVVFGRQ